MIRAANKIDYSTANLHADECNPPEQVLNLLVEINKIHVEIDLKSSYLVDKILGPIPEPATRSCEGGSLRDALVALRDSMRTTAGRMDRLRMEFEA
ncbi:hypothetical protein [Gluconobacter oxydans]|uniref:hypothetical protein n=1 Tax=Gluconobacter oxydans TaxID=442 RepID=UPI000780BC5B|nr:hypothetical protein [Gluconobacter oxydans]KXV12570.1 hypothetical protein AD932_06560 [Gluconobacter oxydans]